VEEWRCEDPPLWEGFAAEGVKVVMWKTVTGVFAAA
jgi:hypothetical protein